MAAPVAFILGLMPAIIWMSFFLWEDYKRPEPKGLILSTFILGGISAFVALQVQVLFNSLANVLNLQELSVASVTIMAGIEEVVKFALVYWWVSKKRDFDEPIDAMVYMIIAALGFATIENIASAAKSPAAFELITLRAIGATLLHSLSSGLVGYYWARSLLRLESLKNAVLKGLVAATIVHALFNSLVLIYGPAWQVTIFLAFVGFFLLNDFEKIKKKEEGQIPEQTKIQS